MGNPRKRSAAGSSSGQKKQPTTSTKDDGTSKFKHPKKGRKPGKFPSPQLLYSVIILLVAMTVSLLWNSSLPTDPRVQAFFKLACSSSSSSSSGGVLGNAGRRAICSNGVVPTRRTLHSVRPVRAGERLVEIPRSMQVWDLDALRNDFVQRELLHARHPRTGNPLASGAFLAAFLSLQLQVQQQQQQQRKAKESNTTEEADNSDIINPPKDPILQSYLELLPKVEELTYHPLLWEDSYLAGWVGGHSLSFSIVRAYRDMVESEFEALTTISPTFAAMINATLYTTSRINVLSRSFSPGKATTQEPSSDFDSWDAELQFYRNQMGRPDYYVEGCHAMVPFLDLLNHHPNPNVVYSYDTTQQAFVITAKTAIPGSWEFMDSYGRFTDPHLFAKFGFLNGDGSAPTQATIALFHRVLDLLPHSEFSYLPFENDGAPDKLNLIRSVQRKGLKNYLQYDDGYESCIEGPDVHPEEFRLKQLKLQHLERIANDPRRWIVQMGPRSTTSAPLESSAIPISLVPPEFNPRRLKVDISSIVATCRLMSLTVNDYEGNAIQMLQDNLDNDDFEVDHGGNDAALEYRALMCVARLTTTSLMQFGASVKEELTRVEEVNRNDFQSLNWTISHLRLSEMQTLNSVAGIAFAHIKKWEDELENPTGPEFTIRDSTCPPEFTDLLLPPETQS